MPPRLKSLKALRAFGQPVVFARAAFSTTAKALADNPPSSVTDLLSSIGDKSPIPGPIRLPFRTAYSPSKSQNSSNKGSLPAGNGRANQHVLNLIGQASLVASNRKSQESSQSTVQELRQHKLGTDLGRLITRRWKAGDVYAPHDLSPREMEKWRKRNVPEYDVFDLLDMNPIDEYKNFSILSEYMTPMGRIKHSSETGLRRVNQRKIAKAIRRGIGLGMMPSVHRHPELLYKSTGRVW